MDQGELERLLRIWGRVYGPAPAQEWEEDSSHGSGALTGCLIDFLRVGVVSGPEPEGITARGKQSEGGAKPMAAHPVADHLDHLCVVLYGEHRLASVVLRAHYCMRGHRKEKLPWVSGVIGQRISRRRFAAELDFARSWMSVAMAKKAA